MKKYLTARVAQHKAYNNANFKISEQEADDALQTSEMTALKQSFDNVLFDGNYVSFHDSVVKNFSERKKNNQYDICFCADAFLYTEQGQEIGKIPVSIQLRSPKSMRDISNKQIYDFAVCSNDHQIGINFFQQHWTQLTSTIIPYEKLAMEYGQPKMYQKRAIKP